MKSAPPETWTILEILRWTTDYFRDKGVSEPRASAEVLLAHVLGLSRLDLYLRYDQPLGAAELASFKALVVRRRKGEPVAYLTGHKEFWSLDFRVAPGVLIPRPETEILVTAALESAKEFGAGGQGEARESPAKNTSGPPCNSSLWGLEVGVGSGAVVVALARELPGSRWVALDLSAAALAQARDNARRHGVAGRLEFLQSDLLSALKPEPRFALLVANLPYVARPQWERLPRDIKDFEPPEAFLGGEDGLALLRPLIRQARDYLPGGGWLALEVAEGQSARVVELLEETGDYERVETLLDYQGIQRVVRTRRRSAG